MAQTNYAYAGELRDPKTAAMLSMIPGLGQFYNGESRKGFLFLDVAIINYALLSVILMAPGISAMMKTFGNQFGMKVNNGVLEALNQMQFGSPVSLVVSGMVIAFVGYAVRDAYDHAQVRRRKAIYKDAVIELPEATSGSYIFHASLILALAISALFFFIPKPPAKQMLEIEFFNAYVKPPTTTVHPPTKALSEQTTKAQSKQFDQTKPEHKLPQKAELVKENNKTHSENKQAETKQVTPAQSQASSSSSSSAAPKLFTPARPVLLAQNVAAVMPVRPITPPVQTAATESRVMAVPIAPIMQRSTAANPIAPALRSDAASHTASSIAPKTISAPDAGSFLPMAQMQTPGASSAPALPQLSQLASGGLPHIGSAPAMPAGGATHGGLKNALQLPNPGGMPQLGGGPAIGPQASISGARNNGTSTSGVPGIEHIATHTGGPGGDGPVPQSIGRGPAGSKHGPSDSGNDDGPKPVRAGHGPSVMGDGPIKISIPTGGPSGANQSGPSNEPLNQKAAPGADQAEGTADPDFTQFMAELQRKIKRSWFPPKDLASKKIKVMFKIHTGGQLSNLRITQGSGSQIADQAALSAVENASPFRHLPDHAPENVDIEFTFDYNVYNSR